MKTTLISGKEIGPDLAAAWRRLQQANADLASPYFHPQFTKIVAEARNDVEVAVLEDGGNVVALLPFQREQSCHAGPVGGIISDYHGLISARDLRFSPVELLKRCRLDSWEFSHLIAAQSSFGRFHWSTEASPQIDLSKGYYFYVEERRAAGSEQIKKTYNLMRRIEREVGPLRFVAESTDPRSLETLLAWKSEQYKRSGAADLFASGWIREAVNRISSTRMDGFSGAVSLLYAGERLVAGHLGMRSDRVWHYWFPSYDPQAARYSPGLMLLLKMAECGAAAGTQIIDLGSGMSSFKERLMNSSTLLASGRVERSSWRLLLGNTSRALKAGLRNTRLGRPARELVQCLRARQVLRSAGVRSASKSGK